MTKDLFGKALLDYYTNNNPEDIITATSISSEDVLPISYLFRSYKQMPNIEQKALQLAKGNVLDVGCGAGNHSLYLQNKGFYVKGIDISNGAITVCKMRGLKYAEELDLLNETKTFDTILLLMNGTGIFETITNLPKYLYHLKTLLKPKGQILIDSSDIKYMYMNNDGSYWHNANANYYGELDYYISYKNKTEMPIKWLYLDFNLLKNACATVGLKCKKVLDGEHFDYLAKLYI